MMASALVTVLACMVLVVSIVASLATARHDLSDSQKSQTHAVAITAALWAIALLLLAMAFR